MTKSLLFSTTTELIRVPTSSIVFISADGNYSSIHMADGNEYVVTLQLGQIERRLSEMVEPADNRFIRIGKSLIVNHEFLTYIHPSHQKMILSDSRTFRHVMSASREALKALKDYIENESLNYESSQVRHQ